MLNFTSFVSVAKTEGEGYMDDADIEEMEQIAQIMYIVIGVLAEVLSYQTVYNKSQNICIKKSRLF